MASTAPRNDVRRGRGDGFRAPLKMAFGFDLRTGVLLIAVFSVVRVALVLQANVTGGYQAVSAVFLVMIALPWLILHRSGRQRIGVVKPTRLRWLAFAGPAGATAAGIVFVMFSLLWGVSVDNPFVYIGGTYSSATSISDESDRVVFFAIFALIAVTLSPLGEELFYRGLVQQCLAHSLGANRAALLDAAAFAVVHLAHFGVVYVAGVWSFGVASGMLWLAAMFLVSLLFDRLRRWSGSIFGAVIGHAGFNLMMTWIIFYALDLF
ncbi:lysostaphin resistance A-like protein [Microbacterium sp.]|uniref:CPBP family intramembrane glutamic endopeptidase n=1 Tax=Microbacterium sp. TaxID=51671 RepID=UPI003F70F6FF